MKPIHDLYQENKNYKLLIYRWFGNKKTRTKVIANGVTEDLKYFRRKENV